MPNIQKNIFFTPNLKSLCIYFYQRAKKKLIAFNKIIIGYSFASHYSRISRKKRDLFKCLGRPLNKPLIFIFYGFKFAQQYNEIKIMYKYSANKADVHGYKIKIQ